MQTQQLLPGQGTSSPRGRKVCLGSGLSKHISGSKVKLFVQLAKLSLLSPPHPNSGASFDSLEITSLYDYLQRHLGSPGGQQ